MKVENAKGRHFVEHLGQKFLGLDWQGHRLFQSKYLAAKSVIILDFV